MARAASRIEVRTAGSPKALLTFCFAATLISICLLPFLAPPSYAVPNQSYVVGYNNKILVIALAVISAVVLVCTLKEAQQPSRAASIELPGMRVRKIWLALVLVAVTLWNGALVSLAYWSHSYGVEDFYILPQTEKYHFFHMKLYQAVEFCYGQLLFYPPIWIHSLLGPFHISVRACYYLSLMTNYLLGTAMLYFVVNWLPMSRGMRTAGFVSISLFHFTPALGTNYTLLRYMLPIASFLAFSKITRPFNAAILGMLLQALVWTDSPELAVGFSAAVAAYSCFRAWRDSAAAWLLPILGLLIGTSVYFGLTNRAVLATLMHAARGANQQIPVISLETATILIATVWIVPRLVADKLMRPDIHTASLLGLYVMGLALLPATLGASDLVHIDGNGAVLFLLSLVAVDTIQRPLAWVWAGAVGASYALLVIRWGVGERTRFYPQLACSVRYGSAPFASLISTLEAQFPGFQRRWPCQVMPLDVAELRTVIGDAEFEAPYSLPEIVEEKLFRTPHFIPSYWSGMIDIWDDDVQRQKVKELRRVDWALLPNLPSAVPVDPDSNPFLGIHVHYRARHPMWIGDLVADEIRQNWALAGKAGNLFVYHRIR